MKNIFKITFSVLFLFLITFYLGIVYILPPIINSNYTINKLEALILHKTGMETNIEELNLKISPTLIVILNIKSFESKNNNVLIIDIKNLSLEYKLLQKHLAFISTNKMFLNGNYLKKYKKEKKEKNNKNFELNNIPEIHIQNLAYESDEINIFVQNINNKNNFINLNAEIKAPFLKKALNFGNSGSLQIDKNNLKANQFEIAIGNSHLYLNGILFDKNKFSDVDIKGDKLPLSYKLN